MKPEIVQSGRCPSCGGELVPLEKADDPDQGGGNHQGG